LSHVEGYALKDWIEILDCIVLCIVEFEPISGIIMADLERLVSIIERPIAKIDVNEERLQAS
jgi:hypothetical protein